MTRLLKRINLFFLILFALILGIFLYILRGYLSYSLSDSDYTFQGINAIAAGYDGKIYAVDNAMKKVLTIENNSQLTNCIDGANRDDSFEYAVKVCDDEKGNIYVSEIIYSIGGILERERIIRFSNDERKVLFEQDYSNYANPPMGFGNVTELKCIGDTVYFIYKSEDALILYEIAGDICMARSVVNCDIDVLDASFDEQNNVIAVSSRQGDLYVNYLNDLKWKKLERNETMQLPNSITIMDGILFSVDEINNVIWGNDISDKDKIGNSQLVLDDGVAYSEIASNSETDTMILSDSESLTLVDVASGEAQKIDFVNNSFYKMIVFSWLLVGIYILLILIFLMRMMLEAMEYFYKSENKASILRVCMVALTAVLVSVSISYTSVINIDEEMMDNERESMDYTMSVMKQYVNPNIVYNMGQYLENYGTEEYEEMRSPFDKIVKAALDNGIEYYYILYTVSDTGTVFVADYERDYCSGQPYMEFGDDMYTTAVQTGETQYDFSDISSYGAYISMVQPFKDDLGNVVALLEIGKPYDQIMNKKNSIIKESIFSVVCSSIVVTMLVLELLFAINFYDRKKKIKEEEIDSTTTLPLRLIAFSIYLADCMQDAFVALLCEKLYNEAASTGIMSLIPSGVAIALPLSFQLLFAALASYLGGIAISKLGTKKVLSAGLIIQMAGMIVCAFMSKSYMGILIGKVLIGLGEGTVYVAANTMAAITNNEENSNKAFADVSAGILSGVVVGAGLGATLFSMGSYQLVYFFGAVVLLLVFILSLSAKDFSKEDLTSDSDERSFDAKDDDAKKPITTAGFFMSREVFAFLMFILTPFMIAISFRDYFFPLYAGENGISELRIGQIYLVCGVVTLYVGPVIAKSLLEKVGSRLSIIIASLAMGTTIAVYLIKPGINIVIFAVVLFSFVTSFAYTCQYAYFESIPQTKRFGESKAMGIYSVFESLGQTIGPMYFGAILSIGTALGLGISALCMVGLTFVFALFSIKRRKNGEIPKKGKKQKS